MATLKNATPQQMPGTAAPTPPVAQYTINVRITPGPSGLRVTPSITAQAADGSEVTPPQGWKIPEATLKAYQDACAAALDAVGPAQLATALEAYGYTPTSPMQAKRK